MDIGNINPSTLFAAGAVGSIIAFWGQLRGWLAKIFSIFIRTDSIHQPIGDSLAQFVISKSKIFRYGNAVYGYNSNLPVKKLNKDRDVELYYRRDFDLILFYRKFIPIKIKYGPHGETCITYLFGTFSCRSILDNIARKNAENRIASIVQQEADSVYSMYEVIVYNGSDSNRTSYGSKDDAVEEPSSPRTKENGISPRSSTSEISFTQYVLGNKIDLVGWKYDDVNWNPERSNNNDVRYYWSKEAISLYNEVKFFCEKTHWFSKKEIPHFRGCCLLGAPGTGKSLMVRKVAQRLNIPVYRLDIANMSNNEFQLYWKKISNESRVKIVLIEDIDVVFEGRTNKLAGKSLNKQLLSFDVLINSMNGIQQSRGGGVFLVVTTNYPEYLDSALTRPGRCDIKITVQNIGTEGKKHICSNILQEWPELHDTVMADASLKTAAEFESKCIEIARNKMYE